MIFQKYFNLRRQKKGMEIEDVTEAVSSIRKEEPMSVKEPISDWGMRFFRLVAICVFLVLAGRVFYLQIMKGDYYSNMAQENRVRYIAIKAPRGLIFDRNGELLVQNIPSFDAVLIPADLPRDIEERNNEVRELAAIFNLNDQGLSAVVNSQNFDSLNPVLIKENVSEEEALVFSEKKNKFPGFQLDKTAVREYESGKYFSSIVGYTGKVTSNELEKYPDYSMTDYIGKLGLEYSYEKYLKGVSGKQKVEVDSLGNIKKNLGTDSPVNGDDLYLGIDSELQKKTQEVLEKKLEETDTKTAAMVAINPRNGEILALVNLPSYDNNLFAKGISADDYKSLISDENKPMFNRAISGEYPPGSTFKPLVATAALQEGLIDAGTTVDCHGGIHIGSYSFPDWKTHGVTNVKKAIAESCDVFFYSVGGGTDGISALGIDRIKKYANLFGLGKITGIDIPGEENGLVPDRSWKEEKFSERWYVGDDYHCAIGQGFITATPLQLANYTAAIANGGKVYRPHIVRFVKKRNGDEEEIASKVINQNFISSSNIRVVQEGMKETVSSSTGSARQLNDLPVAVAGKTGTAQFGSENKTHGWFVSYAPYENPEIAIAVLFEGGGEGSSTAVPITKEIYRWYFEDRK